jgi:anti-sigma B factor antagonist
VDEDEMAVVPDLVLDVRQDGGTAVLRLQGDLDVSTAPELAELCRSVHARGATEVVIDLTETTFLDSAGLRALVGAQRLFGGDGANVRLSHPSETVIRLLDITGLTDYFAIDCTRSG